ncbi:E1-E2 ATPase-domain-containing protein [Daldinia eschscholtzii]|nr:E1-E2 ATPase-domain-containing protein [Daldinia eschscholtzii]
MMGAHEARRPDSSTGTDLEEQGTGFAFSIGELSRLFNPNSLAALEAFGGLRGIEKGLRTDVNRGIGNPHKTLLANSTSSAQSNKSINGTETIDRRVCAYGKNVLPLPKTKSFGLLMRTFCPVKVLFIISLILAISVTFCHFEFIVLCTIIDITVIAVALHSWQREYVSIKAKAERHKWRETKVIRSGKTYLIKLRDVVVGDVLCLDPGDFVPVDGVLISGFGIKMDESRVTRRTGAVEKIPGDDAMRLIHASPKLNDLDPFIFSGSQVLEGVGTFVCTSVGVYSVLGRKTMLSFEEPVPRTPVQKMLDDMERSVFPLISSITSWILGIVIITGTIVIAIPRTICRALRFKICSLPTEEVSSSGLFQTRGKTDSITKTWRARVLAGTISTTSFGQPCWSNMMNEARPVKTIPEWASDLSLVAKDTIIQSIATNSTAFEERTDNTSKFIGSGTEVALLGFAREHLGMQCLAKIRNSEQIVWSIPFDSKLMCMAVVIRLRTGGYRLLVRGAAEMILAHCVARVEVENGNETQLTMADQRTLQSTAEILDGPWRQSICLAYRDYQQWPPTDIRAESGDVDLGILVKDLTFLGIFSIAFPICASYEPSALQSPNLIVRCGRAAVNTVREISWAYGITTGRHQIDCFLGLSPRVGMVMYALITLLLDTNIRGCIELAPSDVNPRTFVVRAHWPAHLDVVALGRTYFFCSILVGIITILLRNIYMPVCRSITYLMERRRSSLYSRMRFQAQARMFEIRALPGR